MDNTDFNKRVDAAIEESGKQFEERFAINKNAIVTHGALNQILQALKIPEPPRCEHKQWDERDGKCVKCGEACREHEWDKYDGMMCVKCGELNIKTYSCKHGDGFSRPCPECFPSIPKETSSYSTYSTKTPHHAWEYTEKKEWAHDETGHLCKVSIKPAVWLSRAKDYIADGNYNLAKKCINEAIELIYGKE